MSKTDHHDELPPHYADFPADPLTFAIGSQETAPLVNLTEVQSHLRLLASFDKLKNDVQKAYASMERSESEPTLDPDAAWVVFVNKAAYRFDKFMSGKWSEDFPKWNEAAIPPLDVVMVWHTYLLNPRTYYDDSIRRTTPFARRLAAMESMPITLIASLIDPDTFEPAVPSYQRESFFERTSTLPFMYSLTTTTSDVVSLACPCCTVVNATVPWITSEAHNDGAGRGFGEVDFEHSCEACSRKFTRSMMGVRKFCEEFTRRRAGRKVYFSETLLDPMTGKEESMLADMMSIRMIRRVNAVFKLPKVCDPEDIVQEATKLAQGMTWSTEELSVLIHQGIRPRKKFNVYDAPLPRVQRIVSAYSNAGYASVDLVAAVLRQGSFIEKMGGLGWFDGRQFTSGHSQAPLFRAIARYHAFLDLMAVKGSSFLVPTLDIDLVWHTHQLSGTAYRLDTQRLLKRTPNHDDSVQPITIQGGYDVTAAAWKERFGVPYSVCGCMPDDSTAPKPKVTSKTASGSQSSDSKKGSRLSFLKSKKPSKSTTSPSPSPSLRSSSDVGSIVVSRTELVAEDADEIDTTHPSEHNLYLQKKPLHVAVPGKKDEPPIVVAGVESDFIARELASKERAQAIKRGTESANTGGEKAVPVDEWRKLQAERKESRGDHREAFTMPDQLAGVYYPYWGVNAAVPFSFYGAVKYEDAVGGCGSGCASCGATPGMGLGISGMGGGGCGGGCGGG